MKKIRRTARASGVPFWKLAECLGVTELTVIRWLRFPLSEEKEAKIRGAIREIAGEDFVDVR